MRARSTGRRSCSAGPFGRVQLVAKVPTGLQTDAAQEVLGALQAKVAEIGFKESERPSGPSRDLRRQRLLHQSEREPRSCLPEVHLRNLWATRRCRNSDIHRSQPQEVLDVAGTHVIPPFARVFVMKLFSDVFMKGGLARNGVFGQGNVVFVFSSSEGRL